MKSHELSEAVLQVVTVAQSRILGVGKEQYEESGNQKFEGMSIPDLLIYFEEELLDQINYAVMNYMRIHNVRVEITKMQQGMERAGLGTTPPAMDIKSGAEFKRKSFQYHKNEIKKEVTKEEEELPNEPEIKIDLNRPLNLA